MPILYHFKSEHRLKKADEFSSVFNFRRLRHGKIFKIYYKPNQLANSRLGLIVSKKVHKAANKRNYMKRFIRESFRLSQSSWHNYDIIVQVRKLYTNVEYLEVKAEFNYLTKIFLKP